MKERPILFSGAMVRAILAGTKTQTRRTRALEGVNTEADAFAFAHTNLGREWWFDRKVPKELGDGVRHVSALVDCPYGVAGDRLWVRETWACSRAFDDQSIAGKLSPSDTIWWREGCEYAATGMAAAHGRWRPSIHMPRWACRIVVEITDVRVQRLRDISDDDARAEGFTPRDADTNGCDGYRDAFAVLWNSINGRDSWDANPWVWALTFKRAES